MNARQPPNRGYPQGDDGGRARDGAQVLAVQPTTAIPREPYEQWLFDLDAFMSGPHGLQSLWDWLAHANEAGAPKPMSMAGLVSTVLDVEQIRQLAARGLSVWGKPAGLPSGMSGDELRAAMLLALSTGLATRVSTGHQRTTARPVPTVYDRPAFEVDDATWNALLQRASKPTDEDY